MLNRGVRRRAREDDLHLDPIHRRRTDRQRHRCGVQTMPASVQEGTGRGPDVAILSGTEWHTVFPHVKKKEKTGCLANVGVIIMVFNVFYS